MSIFKNRRKLYILLSFFLLFYLFLGYAILNTTLGINGVLEVSKNTWDIHFENIVANDEDTFPSAITILESGTEISFDASFTKPGDSCSFLVDIVNSGTIDAKLSEVLKSGLTSSEEKYLNFIVTYKNGKEIKSNDALYASSKETILIEVRYDMDIQEEDLLSVDHSLSLSVSMNYVQDDGTAVDPTPSLYYTVAKSAVLDNVASSFVSSNNGINFSGISSDTNGRGVYTYSSTSLDVYPIHYYRGNVDNNHVLFAGFC